MSRQAAMLARYRLTDVVIGKVMGSPQHSGTTAVPGLSNANGGLPPAAGRLTCVRRSNDPW
jgi:hypothetical protein